PKTATVDYSTFPGMKKEVGEMAGRPKRQLAPVFKPYNNRQSFAIFDVEALIPEHHVARVIDEMIELLPDQQLFSYYPGGGRSSYHPKMMLKVILYAYSQKGVFLPANREADPGEFAGYVAGRRPDAGLPDHQ